MACPCGCRSFPFTDQRLASGGLHGLLIQTPGLFKCGQPVYPNFRHIHPDELALLNGMPPGLDCGNSRKMTLCALGQLASPLQSIWIGGFIMKHLQESNGESLLINPKQCLEYMATLLECRNIAFGLPSKPDSIAFQKMIDSQLAQLNLPGLPLPLPKPLHEATETPALPRQCHVPGTADHHAMPVDTPVTDTTGDEEVRSNLHPAHASEIKTMTA